MRSLSRFWWAPVAATLALAGCTTPPTAEVTRFNIGQPIPSDTIALTPGPGQDGNSLEFRSHAAIVAQGLDGVGLHPAPVGDARAAYVGVLTVAQTTRDGPPRDSGFRIGIGGGSYSGGGGSGGGIGGGVSMPVGGSRANTIRVNTVALQIRRRSDSTMVWEGRVVQEVAADAPSSSLTEALPVLTKALLTGFPGKNGETFKVKTGK